MATGGTSSTAGNKVTAWTTATVRMQDKTLLPVFLFPPQNCFDGLQNIFLDKL
jgi:hypothetical protein